MAFVPSKALSGPMFHENRLQRKPNALPEPLYGVPKLISDRVSSSRRGIRCNTERPGPHGMDDEDDLGVCVAALLLPGGQPCPHARRELPGGHPVAAAPVVRKLEIVLAVDEVHAPDQFPGEDGVAALFPQPRDHLDVCDQRRGFDPVTDIVPFVVGALQREPVDGSSRDMVRHKAPGDVPQRSFPSFDRTEPMRPGTTTMMSANFATGSSRSSDLRAARGFNQGDATDRFATSFRFPSDDARESGDPQDRSDAWTVPGRAGIVPHRDGRPGRASRYAVAPECQRAVATATSHAFAVRARRDRAGWLPCRGRRRPNAALAGRPRGPAETMVRTLTFFRSRILLDTVTPSARAAWMRL